MAKSKKQAPASSGGGAGSKIAKCICDHAFICLCGNRPERPSRGHMWYIDEQKWGGKGHKQKGGSGQVSQVNKAAEVTEKGKTKIEMWQRLPNQLLQEYCKQQKRPPATFQKMENTKLNSSYKFRVRMPDIKDKEKDLQFLAAQYVSNEEQALEEACLIALLHVTPTIPHERKLPEPYRTTWLNAISSQQGKQQQQHQQKTNPGDITTKNQTTINSKNNKDDESIDESRTQCSTNSSVSTTTNTGVAIASSSTTLQMATTFTSIASKRLQEEESRKIRNARIRKHEAIRLANQNHPVFMSAKLRSRIEQFLRGGDYIWDDKDTQDINGDAESNVDDDTKEYVIERLCNEGFTIRQANVAISNTLYTNEESNWENVYNQCLQWLLIHLNEDELPERLDPRGNTLEVVTAEYGGLKPTTKMNTTDTTMSSNDYYSEINSPEDLGLKSTEIKTINNEATRKKQMFLETFVSLLHEKSGVPANSPLIVTNDNNEPMNGILQEELETLDAIFGSNCIVKSNNNSSFTTISILFDETQLRLEVVVPNVQYPTHVLPTRALVHGTWLTKQSIAVTLQIESIKYLADLPLGEPMIFALHGHLQDLLHTDNLEKVDLMMKEDEKPSKITQDPVNENSTQGNMLHKILRPRRPKYHRKSFWNTLSKDTPASVALPISASLDRTRKSLPAANYRETFFEKLKIAEMGNRILLVTGETGSGKSTQLPAYILENNPGGAKIVVSQPRRIAAIGVANRVATERGENKPGVHSVGYMVKGDSASCDRTRILFCTTGVILRQLQNEKSLQAITHIVIDEVHERNLDSDLLIGLIKKYLHSHSHLLLILMSATLDTERFQKYFGGNVPHVHLPGRTFPVSDYTLEDVLSFTRYIPKRNDKKFNNYSHTDKQSSLPKSNSDVSNSDDALETLANEMDPHIVDGYDIQRILKKIDEKTIDYELIACLVKHLVTKMSATDDGSVLIFLPGVAEINSGLEAIKRYCRDLKLLLLPLHGNLQASEQSKVFPSPTKGTTKVILATNVAETSVTIPDCTIVIDTAREKQSSYDSTNRMPILVDQFASKASLQQRRGRAGRVREGTCYKLISKTTIDKLKDHSEPEIKRVALDQVLLQLLFLGVEDGTSNFLDTLLDPPTQNAIDAASFSLLKLGALDSRGNDGKLTLSPLGVHLSGIPAPPVVGKMLIMGSVLGCREAALAMAAGLSMTQSPFLRVDTFRPGRSKGNEPKLENSDQDDKQRILDERRALSKTAGNSDHALLSIVYSKWKKSDYATRNRFCESLSINKNVMRDLASNVDQLDAALTSLGFMSTAESDCNHGSLRIIHACAVAAMAPSQIIKVVRPGTKYEETAQGAKLSDGLAKELRFFIRVNDYADINSFNVKEERVFIHPSSINFDKGTFPCPFLVYNSLVVTSKPFLRDVTECSTYTLLLFGGPIEVQASNNVIVIDNYVNLAASARIASLIGGLRKKVDSLLFNKITDPNLELSTTKEMQLIVQLIKTDGLA